jgi:uncharacterized membrane protein
MGTMFWVLYALSSACSLSIEVHLGRKKQRKSMLLLAALLLLVNVALALLVLQILPNNADPQYRQYSIPESWHALWKWDLTLLATFLVILLSVGFLVGCLLQTDRPHYMLLIGLSLTLLSMSVMTCLLTLGTMPME